MGIRQSVRARAITGGHAGLSALIGTRCYPDRLPEKPTLPALRYQIISSPPMEYRDHDASPPDRWVWRVQIDGWDKTSDEAAALGDQMFAAFEGWNSGTAVGWSRVENQFGEYDVSLNRYRRMVEVVIDHHT